MRTLRHLLRVLLCGAALVSVAFAADANRKSYNIPAGDAAAALKQFSEISGRETLFAADALRGVKTPAVQGELTPQEAIDALLSDTGLVATVDEKTGAIAVRRETPEELKNGASRLAERETAGAATIRDGAVQLDNFEVRSSRIDGLNNKGLLQGGADGGLYHDVVTRDDIDRMGVSSLEELFRLLPQTSSPTNALQGAANNSQFTGGATTRFSTMGLRGFGSAQTVILINGRSLPRSGEFDNNGADLSRIPLAAIERVEILPYAGSAIYGSGAIGGAINIILRKEYVGKDLTLYAATSTDGGATEFRMNYVDGRVFNEGRTSLTLTVSYQHREPLYARDRGYLDRALERFAPGSGVVTASGHSAFEQLVLPALAGAPGVIVVGSSASPATDLGIPGAPGARYAMIPPGTNASQSFGLTPGSFTSTAGQFVNGGRYGRSVLYEPIDNTSLNAQVEHEFVKDKLTGYGEFTAGFSRKNYSYPQQLAIDLAANDPLNPFRTGVTPGFIGRPVRIYLDAIDLPDSSSLYKSDNARAVVGLKGQINERWEWSADGVIDYTHNTVVGVEYTSTISSLNTLNLPPGAASAGTRRAIYPILADHTAVPISGADGERYFRTSRHSGLHGTQKEGNARLTGDLLELPAGPMRVSAMTKYQRWSLTSGQTDQATNERSQLLTGLNFTPTPSYGTNARNVWQGAFEFTIPVIGAQWRPIPIESLELQGSASYETVDTISNTTNSLYRPGEFTRHADSQVIAAKLQITPDIAFRASYSDAFYPPNWSAVTQAPFSFPLPGIFPDAARGNTIQSTPWNYAGGGNPDLQPERANSENYGVIVTPRALRNFSLHLDYWKIEKTNAVTYPDLFAAWSNPDTYAYAITRAAPTPADQAMGWLGVVTQISTSPFNAASVSTEGFDARLRYIWTTSEYGSFAINANASYTNNFLLQISPSDAPVDQLNAGGAAPVKWRGLASGTWSKGKWAATLTGRYVGHYYSAFTDPSPVYPNARPIDGGRIPAYLHWDLQLSYEVPSVSGHGWRDWLAGTKWTLGANNILNREPAFSSGFTTTGAGSTFYNSYDDPRQRLVYLTIRKSL